MRRDGLPTKTKGTNVTEYQTANTSAQTYQGSSQLPLVHKESAINLNSSTENNNVSIKAELSGRQFYNSYDPEVGINIASVLGGLLVLLVIYVIYRTKCRKRMLGGFQKCIMKYFPEEFSQADINQQYTVDVNSEDWISESAKMIWKERAHLSRASVSSKPQIEHIQSINEHSQSCRQDHSCNMQVSDFTGQDSDILCPQLPDSEENIERATATWVQNVKHMDVKERQLNGIILKIPSDLLSHNAKMRSQFHSVTDYGETNELVTISQRNKSLPSLVEQHTCVKMSYANNTKDNKVSPSNKYFPLATHDEGLDLRPLHLEVKHQSGSTVPLDICPIVKVQHYHSRSKRRLTSLCNSSSEDASSSDEQHTGTKTLSKTASDAKYMRLDTIDYSIPVDDDISLKMEDSSFSGKREPSLRRLDTTVCAPLTDTLKPLINNHSKHPKSLETNL